jgi:hypothetical protein
MSFEINFQGLLHSPWQIFTVSEQQQVSHLPGHGKVPMENRLSLSQKLT